MRYLFILLLLVVSDQVCTQNLFQDAKLIGSKYDRESGTIKIRGRADSDGIMAKLAYYSNYDSAEVSTGQVFANDVFSELSEGNPFFTTNNEEFGKGVAVGFSSQFQNVSIVNPALAVAADAPGDNSTPFSITKIADGFARFLVTRTKEELSIAFFRRFYRQLDQQRELQVLFPSTYQTLETAETEIYVYQRYLESLRYSFISDLELLPTQLQYYLQTTPLINNQVAQYTVLDVLQLSQYLINEKTGEQPQERNFWDYLNYLADSSFIHNEVINAKPENALRIIDGNINLSRLIAKSFWNQVDSTWEDPAEVFRALSDPVTLKVYLGLLYYDAKDLEVGKNKDGTWQTFGQVLKSSSTDLKRLMLLKSEMQRFVENSQQFNTSLKALENRSDTVENIYPLLYPMLESMFNMFECGFQLSAVSAVANTKKFNNERIAPEVFFRLLRQLNEFNLHISQKRYAASITNMLGILQEVGNFEDINNNKLVKEVFRYGYFVAAVAESENSQDVANAIEVFALPQGSGNQKKYNNFSVTLQAYSGLTYGSEYLSDLDEEESGDIDSLRSPILAVSAPIGLAFNIGMRKYGSLSLFGSAVDIGALTAFRFNDPNSADLPAFEWQNIVSPGLYLVYGLPWDLPISLGGGVQSGPQLRRVDGNFAIEQSKARRWGVFLSVDIPITQFYGR
ncbi:MAG: hypothetical protein AAFO02_04785 [Bacteroidota bacterium]